MIVRIDAGKLLEIKNAEARAKRNSLLAASDWTQISDAPVDKAAWAAYRQQLRDITAQSGFPESITWPLMVGANSTTGA